MNSAVVALKRALRKDIKAQLRSITPATLATESQQVVDRLLTLEEYRASKHVSVYISMPSGEVDTKAIIRDLLHSDKVCYVPRWTKDAMEMVKIKSWDEYLSLPVNKWNIPEPPHDQVMENALEKDGLDLIIVPGKSMGFDEDRNRIGHGKGYYDKFIQNCHAWAGEHQRAAPKTVGLALNSQVLEKGRIPLEPTDQKIDCILTPSKTIQ
ncbi:5-formyltetrahydrofolate cyclo-ligase [Lichtheimia hyalospora FSU 10163]|nr:5-formyltetrahydrofolate cyclo-ligase [Lichtheimia hyalospora FSU 10163]